MLNDRMIDDRAVGPYIATVLKYNKTKGQFAIILPMMMVKEIIGIYGSLEHLDKVRVAIEKIEGMKGIARPNAFKKKVEVTQDGKENYTAKIEEPEIEPVHPGV